MENNKIEQEQYNGWKNFDTWLLNLNLTNEQGLYDAVYEWVKENPIENFELGILRIDAFKEFLEDSFWIDEYNIYHIFDSWTTRDWENIDFQEIIKYFDDEER